MTSSSCDRDTVYSAVRLRQFEMACSRCSRLYTTVTGTVDCSSLSPLRTKDSRSGVVDCLQVIVAVPRRCGTRRPREPFRAMHAYVFWWRETNYVPISTNRNKITDNHNDDSYSVPGVDVSRPQFCLYHSSQCICGSRSHFSVRLLRRK
jgi:hypothetical protein